MKPAAAHIDSIVARITLADCVLLFDFDGTLVPLGTIELPSETRSFLGTVAQVFPTAVVSGRSLLDIRQRVNLPISFAGTHGLEMQIAGSDARAPIELPEQTSTAFQAARRSLEAVALKYVELFIEDKGLSYALNYRALSQTDAVRFTAEAEEVLREHSHPGGIRFLHDLYTIDIMPDTEHTKGDAAFILYSNLRRKGTALPVYLGDGYTDEDAFKKLRASGITIRVGENPTSAAQYFFDSQEEVIALLRRLAAL